MEKRNANLTVGALIGLLAGSGFSFEHSALASVLNLPVNIQCLGLRNPDVRLRAEFSLSDGEFENVERWKKFFERPNDPGAIAECEAKAILALRSQLRAACWQVPRNTPNCSPAGLENQLRPLREQVRDFREQAAAAAEAPPETAPSPSPLPSPSVSPSPVPSPVPPPPPPAKGTEKLCADCGQPARERQSEIPSDLFRLNEKLDKAPGCAKPEIGVPQLIIAEDATSPTGVEQRYRLTRKGEKEYEAALNLDFAAPEGQPEFAEGIRQRTLACIEQINSKLLGPDGSRLKLRLTDAREPNPPPLLKVDIEVPGFRSHSRRYAQDVECPAIAHELMHVLGLVDEYPEMEKTEGYLLQADGSIKRGETQKHNCRVIGPRDSLMNEHNRAFQKVFGTMRVVTCRCFNSCPPNWENWNPKTEVSTCPDGGSGIYYSSEYHPVTEPSVKKLNDTTLQVTTLGPGPTRKSLLEPAEFYSIVFPGCSALKDFYDCAKNAYISRSEKGCPSVPPSCAKGNQDWLNPKIKGEQP